MGYADGFYYGQNKIVVTSEVAGDSGKLVTVTSSGGTVYSDTFDANLELSFTVPGNDRYDIIKYSDGTPTTEEYTNVVYAQYGGYHEIKVAYDTDTFDGIQKILNAHLENDLLDIGDEVSLTIGGSIPMTWQIAAINHEPAYAHQVIFTPKWCLPTSRQMNSTNTNVGGWNSSTLRTWLNGDFFNNYIPADLQLLIADRDIISSQGNQSTALQTATDKIWLPREYEIFGATTYATATEHTGGNAQQFPIFATASNRIKTLGQSGSVANWYECSPYTSNATGYCLVSTSGAAGNNGGGGASAAFGVAPCFHLIAD